MRKPILLPLILIMALVAACSTTSRIPDGEQLYNGMKLNVHYPGGKLPPPVLSELQNAVNVKPNNPWPLLSPYVRMPIPYGLWVYNHIGDSATGIKRWIYDTFGEAPVLVSDVRPEARVKMLRSILDSNGFFGNTESYTVQDDKNPKKGTVVYNLNVTDPYMIDSLQYMEDGGVSAHYIDSLARRSKYLVKGERFSVDSLASERVRIANSLRNQGFYYFRPEYIEFLADTLITPKAVALRITLAENVPVIAKQQYRTGTVTTYVLRRNQEEPGVPDTIDTPKGEVIVYRPARLSREVIPNAITFRRGRLFSVRDMDRTQNRLARLGMFGNIMIQPVPADTSTTNTKLDVVITCQFDRPLEGVVQANVVSKSNSYIGPGVEVGVTNNNTFGGGEKLSLRMNAGYEWQTGKRESNVFNSYEFGLTGTLAVPRFLAPNFIPHSNWTQNWTTFSLGADLMNRPHYFKLADFHVGVNYEWHATRNSVNQFIPFKINYNKLISTTQSFDSVMAANPAVALSFRSQYIPQMSYTYSLDKYLEREKINGINLRLSFTEAGNIFSTIYSAFGVKGEKRLFGTPFSQFVKGEGQIVYSRRLIPAAEHWLVSRLLVGAAHAYGNSSVVPYSEQFYIGGANSIRAFTVRSLGPGSYRPPASMQNGYFDQTGTFKLEFNTEYRFPLVSVLRGAIFLDTGNIWLLKPDSARPGGLLTSATFLRDVAVGTGVGLRVDMGMMVVRGDLGYGLHAPYATSLPGYFNIPFKNAFAFHLAIGYPF